MDALAKQTPADIIVQLEQARIIAIEDPTHYLQIIPTLLPIFGPASPLELRRYGADLIAEALSSPFLPSEQKEQLSLRVVERLREYLDNPSEDVVVIESVIQAATSVYPLIFKHTIYNPSESAKWQEVLAIKSNILKREVSAPAGVKVCCVKFIQRIVQVQTPGLISDPRRLDQNELSSALVPSDHPIFQAIHLQAEAFGLLDRMLNVFQDEDDPSNALLVTATLNSIGILVRTRVSVANRILNAVLSFNPFALAGPNVAPRIKLTARSMERTIRAFLVNLNKRNPNHQMAGRIQAHLDRLQHERVEVFEERGLKRPPPSEPTDGLDNAKRHRLDAEMPEAPPQQLAVSSLPGNHCTLAQMYALTNNDSIKAFDVKSIPEPLLFRYIMPLLAAVDRAQLTIAVAAVSARWEFLRNQLPASAMNVAKQGTEAVDDDEEYQPEDEAEKIINRLDRTMLPTAPPAMQLGPFTIPQPPPLSADEAVEYGKGTVMRVFGMAGGLQEPNSKAPKSGFNRVAASTYDRDSWITVVSRLATRPVSGLDTDHAQVKAEHLGTSSIRTSSSIADSIRESLFHYVLEDWRRRLDVAVSWLNEEWYNDTVSTEDGVTNVNNYGKWVLRVFDGILPYLDAKDKGLIRFVSEIPSIDHEILARVKSLAQDPERVSLAVNALYYLILYRPPVREMCIDALEDLYRNYEEAKGSAAKLLQKYRPLVLQASAEVNESKVKPEVGVQAAIAT